ncbi:MAG: hypothetical protein H0X17_06795 [Deltaproteobacteria bacterium]|nr:hypothetical protein [Deltaproteobacteria bacterium]
MRSSFALIAALLAACSATSKPDRPPPPSTAGSNANCTAPAPAPDSVCLQDCGPPVSSEGDPVPGWRWVTPAEAASRQQHGCPICLPPDALIATPRGEVPVSSLVAGSIVWSTDEAGRRIAVPVVAVGSTPAPRDHGLVVVGLADGREVTASPGHPTADARALGTLVIGDVIDGSTVIVVKRRAFGEQRTFDVLPASPTRAYWANGVLLASTLR